jgi:hypothetical protein
MTSLANTNRVQIRISFTKSSLDLGAQLTTVTRALYDDEKTYFTILEHAQPCPILPPSATLHHNNNYYYSTSNYTE